MIFSFKQRPSGTIRKCSNRLKLYIARCPKDEIPCQERLVSSFLEGLVNKILHASLYTNKYIDLDTCIKAAIDLDGNCDIYQEETLESGASSQSSTSTTNDVVPRVESPPSSAMPFAQELANEVVQRLNFAQQFLKQNEPMCIESTNQKRQENNPKLDIGTLLYFSQKQVSQMMKPQNKMEKNAIGSHNHGEKNGLNTIEQFKGEYGDVQRFCDDCLVTQFIKNYSNNLENNHTRDKGKLFLHVVNAIPSKSGEEEKDQKTLVQVVTRAQALL